MKKIVGPEKSSPIRLAEVGWQVSNKELNALFVRHIPVAKRIIRRYITDDEVAQDLVQDACEKVTDEFHKHHYKDEGYFKAYFVRVAINKTLDFLRKEKKRNRAPIEALEKIESDLTAEENVKSEEGLKWVNDLIDKIPKWERPYMRLRYNKDMSDKQIAAELNQDEHTVSAALCKAHKWLEQFLLKNGYDPGKNIFERR